MYIKKYFYFKYKLNQTKAKEILDLIENFKGFYEGKFEEIDKIVEINESLISNNM